MSVRRQDRGDENLTVSAKKAARRTQAQQWRH